MYRDVVGLGNTAGHEKEKSTLPNKNPEGWTTPFSKKLVQGRQKGIANPARAKLDGVSFSDFWLQRQRIQNHFWSRWKSEYLQELSVNKKWSQHDGQTVEPGDVVLIKPDSMEKNSWKLARVEEVQRNQDGAVATATLRLPSRQIITRSVRQIARLESSAVEAFAVDTPPLGGPAGYLSGRAEPELAEGREPRNVLRVPRRGRPCH